MSRLRRELTAPYPDLGVHHSMLASTGAVAVPTFKVMHLCSVCVYVCVTCVCVCVCVCACV